MKLVILILRNSLKKANIIYNNFYNCKFRSGVGIQFEIIVEYVNVQKKGFIVRSFPVLLLNFVFLQLFEIRV